MNIGADERLALALAAALVQGKGMNELLHQMLEEVRGSFSIDHIALYDYDEFSGTFDLLYFCGFPNDARSGLRTRMQLLHLHRSLDHREPYWADEIRQQLLVPLYFQDTLEAVMLLEGWGVPLQAEDPRWSRFRVASRLLGLLMSSSRLPVNQKARPVNALDLERARDVQLEYLPAAHPVTDSYEIFGFNRSSALVGGDYYDYFKRRTGTVQCVIADACGHGMAAALIMSTFRGLLLSEIDRHSDLGSLFARLNDHLFTGGDLIQYLTTVFLDYDEAHRRLHYLNAGHFDPLIVHADGSASSLPGGGPPLGMFRTSSYSIGAWDVRPNDLLVLFTDGLVELRNPREEYFGVQGITSTVSGRRHLPLDELGREVLQEAVRFSQRTSSDDDLTLFLVKFK